MTSAPLETPGSDPVELAPTPTPWPRSKKRLIGGGAAFAAAAIAVALALVATGGAGPLPSAAAAENVRHALAVTFEGKTMGFTFTESITAEGQSLTFKGTGACILKGPECDMTLRDTQQLPTGGTIGTFHDVMTASTLYEKLPASLASHVSKPWVSMSMGDLTKSPGAVGNNPLSGMVALAHEDGGKVTALGSATVDGARTKEYLVHLSAKAMRAAVHGSLRRLPSWMRVRVSTAFSTFSLSETTMHVFINESNRVVKLDLAMTATKGGVAVGIDEALKITSFGPRVTIQLPPPSEVLTMQQFERQAANSEG